MSKVSNFCLFYNKCDPVSLLQGDGEDGTLWSAVSVTWAVLVTESVSVTVGHRGGQSVWDYFRAADSLETHQESCSPADGRTPPQTDLQGRGGQADEVWTRGVDCSL